MSQYVTKELAVESLVASAALKEGQVCKASSGYVTPITANTDVWFGVAMTDIPSGSNGNIAVRGLSGFVKGKVDGTVAVGTPLYVSASAVSFTVTPYTNTQVATFNSTSSNLVTTASVVAYAVEAGSANDLVNIKLV